MVQNELFKAILYIEKFSNNSDEARMALTSFLSAILGDTVCDVEIGQNELPVESERDKQAIFDITCR